MTTTLERIGALLVKQYEVPPESITPEATLESLGIDSLGTVELLWNIEDAFHIKLPSDPQNLFTLGDVARLVDELAAAQATPAASTLPGEPAV